MESPDPIKVSLENHPRFLESLLSAGVSPYFCGKDYSLIRYVETRDLEEFLKNHEFNICDSHAYKKFPEDFYMSYNQDFETRMISFGRLVISVRNGFDVKPYSYNIVSEFFKNAKDVKDDEITMSAEDFFKNLSVFDFDFNATNENGKNLLDVAIENNCPNSYIEYIKTEFRLTPLESEPLSLNNKEVEGPDGVS